MMERKQNRLQGILAGIGLLVLIFDSNVALEGARSGIELCIKTVIPSLFPFFVLSIVLTNSLGEIIPHPLQKFAGFLGIPVPAASILIPAFLGGYPVGAKCVGDMFQRGQIRRQEAERLLAFCSNAGPSFLFGMVSGFFPEIKFVWLLWMIHILSAILTAVSIPAIKIDKSTPAQVRKYTGGSIILSAATAMIVVCCWVILFRTIIAFLSRWFLWMLPGWAQLLVMGTLELTNGCCALLLATDLKLRFLLCSCMLSLGGICVLLQTISVVNGLSVREYLKGKLIQTLFSFLISYSILENQRLFLMAFIPASVILLRKIQNRYGNPRTLPV